jgi:hypothetical protein
MAPLAIRLTIDTFRQLSEDVNYLRNGAIGPAFHASFGLASDILAQRKTQEAA